MKLNFQKGIFCLIVIFISFNSCGTLQNNKDTAHEQLKFDDIEFDVIRTQVNPDNNGESEYYENFNLVIRPVSKHQQEIADANTELLQLHMLPAFSLVVGTDTMPCVFYHMEPKFVDGSYRAVLSFELTEKPENKHLSLLFNATVFEKPILTFKIPNS